MVKSAEKGAGRPMVVCFGEVIWDVLPGGRRELGGAPANVAYHLGRLGFEAILVSRIGRDELGGLVRKRLEQAGLSTRHVQVDEVLPTGSATVSVDSSGEISYEITTPAAWDAIGPTRCGEPDVVVFGTLAQRHARSRAALRQLAGRATERVYDVNFRPPHTPLATVTESLGIATVVKMNESEARWLSRELGLADEPGPFAHEIMKRYGPRVVCVTRGGLGAWLVSDDRFMRSPGVEAEECDTVGAGDAFLAGLVAGLLSGEDWPRTLQKANELGAWVASKPGAMP